MVTCYEHFTSVAPLYRQLRATDEAPVKAIQSFLDQTDSLSIADIGCGTGRYSQLLFHHMGPATKMFCVDVTRAMLHELSEAVHSDGISNHVLVQASASSLPFYDNTMDVITSFNAIHHFDLSQFLKETRRVLKEGCHAFLYTRLREQNATTIWGKFFPNFHETETRLYIASEVVDCIRRHFQPGLISITPFSFPRQSSLEALLDQARQHHYSTFSLYDRDEFDFALGEFERNIRAAYADPSEVYWIDSYTLFSLTKQNRDRN